jgi:hypothetical protein
LRFALPSVISVTKRALGAYTAAVLPVPSKALSAKRIPRATVRLWIPPLARELVSFSAFARTALYAFFDKTMKNAKFSLKAALSRFNFRLVIALAVSIIFFLGIFLVVWEMGYEILISCIYGAITLIAALWYMILNKGFVGKLPSAEELPLTWDKKTREDFIKDLKARRQKSKKLMLILVPMLFTFTYKLLELYVFPHLAIFTWFSAFFE